MKEDLFTAPAPGSSATLFLPGLRISVVEGADVGREVTASRGVLRVGTAPDNDLVLTDDAVSRRHFEVRVRPEEVRIADLGSTNGTTVDGVRIVEALLSSASLIRVGGTSLRVTPADEPIQVALSARTRFGALLGGSAAMREVFGILERVAPTDATVIIEGETGTGKELAAEAIHAASPRADAPFVAVDCGAIAENLIESELFGHVRGSFTGAIGDRRGVFEEADSGTLFLDEIGELPLELQPKLLRALEKREIRRVGESRPRRVDVRVLAATNRDLAVEVNRGRFREDLYFRLAVVQVRLPPLRARMEDLPLLVEHFAERLGAPGRVPELLLRMQSRPFPGNVRELRNAVERAIALGGPEAGPAPPPAPLPPGWPDALRPLLDGPYKEALADLTARFEVAYVTEALRRSGGSVSGAARLAGLSRRYVQKLMHQHGLRDDEDSGGGGSVAGPQDD